MPGRLTLRPLRIYDAGINGIRALNLNTTYSLYILATTGERSNSVTLITPATCTVAIPSPSPVVSPSPVSTIKPEIVADQTSSYCENSINPRIHLQWQEVPGVGIYKIFRETSAPGSGIKVGETSGIALNDDNITSGTNYKYTVEATFPNGSSNVGSGYNITAVSCQSSTSPSPSTTRKTGDINNDGKVDIFDFNILIGDFNLGNTRSDLNNDEKVNIFDFNILLTNFGR
jgi:hypothetical protein